MNCPKLCERLYHPKPNSSRTELKTKYLKKQRNGSQISPSVDNGTLISANFSKQCHRPFYPLPLSNTIKDNIEALENCQIEQD